MAWSYLQSGGFWTHEALIVVEQALDNKERLVVVEGNRRLAALKLLKKAQDGEPISSQWTTMAQYSEISDNLFSRVPYLLADSRGDIQAFLGFRHVTGIKQWDADEKAMFIASLIDEHGMSYQDVMRKIGSNTPTVRRHYIAYRMLLQMEDTLNEFDPSRAERRFAVLYMSIDTVGAQSYLNIDITAPPGAAREPVPEDHLQNLAHFARWLFGTQETSSHIVRDTRQVADFGRILESQEATKYLEEAKSPSFEVAFRLAGGDEEEIIRHVAEAANSIELALMRAHSFRNSEELCKEARRLGEDAIQLLDALDLLNISPKIKKTLLKEIE